MSKDFVKVALGSIPELSVGKTRNTIKLYSGSPKKQIMFDMPLVRLPFGASIDRFKTYTNNNVYYLETSVNEAFTESWNEFTEKLVDVVDTNRETFDTNLSRNEIKAGFKNGLKTNDYGSLLKLNLPRDRLGDFSFHVFDKSKQKLNVDDSNIATILSKGTYCKALVKVSKMWSFKDKDMFGLTLELFQLKLADKPEVVDTGSCETEGDEGDIEGETKCPGEVKFEFLE